MSLNPLDGLVGGRVSGGALGGLGQADAQMLKAAYEAQRQYQPPAPKEIGFLTRAEGLCTGLEELHTRLEGLAERIAGAGMADKPKGAMPPQPGLHAALSTAEDRLRQCLSLLVKLTDAF